MRRKMWLWWCDGMILWYIKCHRQGFFSFIYLFNFFLFLLSFLFGGGGGGVGSGASHGTFWIYWHYLNILFLRSWLCRHKGICNYHNTYRHEGIQIICVLGWFLSVCVFVWCVLVWVCACGCTRMCAYPESWWQWVQFILWWFYACACVCAQLMLRKSR